MLADNIYPPFSDSLWANAARPHAFARKPRPASISQCTQQCNTLSVAELHCCAGLRRCAACRCCLSVGDSPDARAARTNADEIVVGKHEPPCTKTWRALHFVGASEPRLQILQSKVELEMLFLQSTFVYKHCCGGWLNWHDILHGDHERLLILNLFYNILNLFS